MICSKCGSNCANDTKFCPICGTAFPAQDVFSGAASQEPQAADTSSTQYTQGYNQQYNQNPYNQPRQDYGYTNPQELTESSLPENLRPLSPWAYLGYWLLFSMVPCAGIILAFVFAFGNGENVNKRNFARFYLITLAIGFIISLFLVILMTTLGFTFTNALYQYGGFY
jgi:hypothetical protein